MGQIEQDIVKGKCCAQCLKYFQNPKNPDKIYKHGYPVLCTECWKKGDFYNKSKV